MLRMRNRGSGKHGLRMAKRTGTSRRTGRVCSEGFEKKDVVDAVDVQKWRRAHHQPV